MGGLRSVNNAVGEGEVGKVPKIYNQMLLRLTLEVIKREVCGGVKGGGGLGGRAGEGQSTGAGGGQPATKGRDPPAPEYIHKQCIVQIISDSSLAVVRGRGLHPPSLPSGLANSRYREEN